jgi:hypothetical protein
MKSCLAIFVLSLLVFFGVIVFTYTTLKIFGVVLFLIGVIFITVIVMREGG